MKGDIIMATLCCSNCDWYDRNSTYYMNSNMHKCKNNGSWKCPTDSCKDHSREEVKSTSSSSEFKPTGCYITTMICDILGYSDDCEILSILRLFRENILKCDFKYTNLLLQYDIVGPEISNHLKNMENSYDYSKKLLDSFLIPCIYAIREGYVEEAVKIYKNMVETLCETFNIELVSPKRDMEYEARTLGKGRRLVKNFGPLKSA